MEADLTRAPLIEIRTVPPMAPALDPGPGPASVEYLKGFGVMSARPITA